MGTLAPNTGWLFSERLLLGNEICALQTGAYRQRTDTGTPHDGALKGREHPKRANP